MDSPQDKNDFKVNFNCFKSTTKDVKEAIFNGRKADNTNRATITWVTCFKEYLTEKQLKPKEQLSNAELASVLSDFYVELRKKKVKKITHKLGQDGKVVPEHDDRDYYKNTSLKCLRAALNCHFKATRNIDIINNEIFIQSNEMFQGVTKKGKCKGRDEIESKLPIEEEDMEKISNYFKKNMRGPPNPAKLQEMMLFNVIYYGGRRGRENLRYMTKKTFEVTVDRNQCHYIHQVLKEHDKNHKETDFSPSNEARIYEKPGKLAKKLP